MRDERLRLIFTCCHPALAPATQVALTLRLLGGLTTTEIASDLDGYHLFHAIRADLLRRLGRNAEAVLAYEAAIAGTGNTTERDFLQRSRQALTRA